VVVALTDALEAKRIVLEDGRLREMADGAIAAYLAARMGDGCRQRRCRSRRI